MSAARTLPRRPRDRHETAGRNVLRFVERVAKAKSIRAVPTRLTAQAATGATDVTGARYVTAARAAEAVRNTRIGARQAA